MSGSNTDSILCMSGGPVIVVLLFFPRVLRRRGDIVWTTLAALASRSVIQVCRLAISWEAEDGLFAKRRRRTQCHVNKHTDFSITNYFVRYELK